MEKNEKGPIWRSRLGKIGLGALATGMILFAATAVYALATLPALQADELNAPVASVVYDMDNHAVGPLSGPEQRDPVRFNQIPKVLREAFVASEDARFYKHPGVDPIGIARAAFRDLIHLSLQEGGSTITQQVVKNAVVGARRTPVRKIQEIVLALELERRYTKDEILGFYLNQIYMGHGAYGVGAAARTYFGHDLAHVTLGEAATLTGLTPGPSVYDPFIRPDLAQQRRDLVLDRMVAAGYLDQAAAAAEKVKPLGVSAKAPNPSRPYDWFMDVVRREVIARYGLKDNEVETAGLKIYTTLDTRTQSAADKVFGNAGNFPDKAPPGLEAAMAILDPKSGAVRAVVGGRRYTIGGQNRAVDARRSPGSTLKPVLAYGPALEARQLTPNSLVEDSPIDVNGWRPLDFDGEWRGKVTVREALRLSLNVPAVRVLQQVGVPQATSFAGKLGITLDPSDRSLAIALGGLTQGISPLQEAGAYQAFANGGIYNEPHLVARVVTAGGGALTAKTETHAAMRPDTAATITDMLKTVVRSGTGQGALLDRPMAGKTGTAELPDVPEFAGLHGNNDAWFAGYTPDLVGVVWMGYDRTDRQHYLPADVNGSTYPTQLWKQVMEQALAGRPATDFPGLQPAAPAAPATPTTVTIQGLTAQVDQRQGTVTLQWQTQVPSGQPNPAHFHVFRGTAPDMAVDPNQALTTVNGPPALDKPGQRSVYYYRVAAVDPTTGQMGPASAAVKADLSGGLPGIVNLTAAADGGKVSLRWDTDLAPGASVRFLVLRGDSADVPVDAAHSIATVQAPPASDTPAAAGVYYYRVVSADTQTGQMGQPSATVKVTVGSGAAPPATPPEARNLKAAVDAATGRVTLSWSTPADARVSWRIFRAKAAAPDGAGVAGNTASPTYTDQPGPGSYLYRVAAVDPSTGATGPLSDPVAVTVPAPATGAGSGTGSGTSPKP